VDPWHDYLAFPVAPLVLLGQLIALFLRPQMLRWALEIACPLAIIAMFAYVSSLQERPDEGVNIGAGVLLLWMVLSLSLLVVTLVVEAIRHQRAPRFTDSP
jgi:hypothetical protein